MKAILMAATTLPHSLQRLTDELRTTLSLLDSEQLSFDFKSEKNDTHPRPEFIEVNTGSNHDLPHDSKLEDYFGLFYTDERMQQVSVVLYVCTCHWNLETIIS